MHHWFDGEQHEREMPEGGARRAAVPFRPKLDETVGSVRREMYRLAEASDTGVCVCSLGTWDLCPAASTSGRGDAAFFRGYER